jgi:deoxycytidine triphosphate deaminase
MLSDTEILKHMETGHIVIEPFEKNNLQPNSYDVRLGRWYYRSRAYIDQKEEIVNPYNPRSSERWVLHCAKPFPSPPKAIKTSTWTLMIVTAIVAAFACGPMVKTYADFVSVIVVSLICIAMVGSVHHHSPAAADDNETQWPSAEELGIVDPNQDVIILGPGECILAHTDAIIGTRMKQETATQIAATLQTRSSFGRNDVDVCASAGLIDTGYANRITLEIRNLSAFSSIILYAGERVGQVVFHYAGVVEKPYCGSYHPSVDGRPEDNVKRIAEAWKPEMMLPHLRVDLERKLLCSTLSS